MIACPNCGFEAPDDFAFCPKCATALAPSCAHPEERKTVTTLFCDLVAFTAMSEASDPEDVDALLSDYFARAAKVIESHGGTVEKFIGDAVVGVFGVPQVHEDDPERAVRAGLRLIEALEGLTRPDGLPLQARVGINTGEALVRLDVDPSSGRGFLTGDAVNVAARLQAAAPPNGVAVGAPTRDLTARAIDYEELPAIAAKGKTEPVTAWRAVAPVSRRGLDSDASDLTPFVGREVELAYLSAIFDKVTAQSLPQCALLIGEPGIGKSRLVRELLELVDARTEMTTWRQGYCPPFGENITYWALAEIVKGHAGIRDTDDAASVDAKLEAVLPSGPDREWFRQRLRALLGLDAPEALREENFTAWMRFFEDVAAKEPAVLVFEDLHWADGALLAFLEHLTTHLASVPLLVVGTARPELFERAPSFASGGTVNRVVLGPLSPGETARLVAGLLRDPDDRARAVGEVVQRCEGNPFYAEQSARLLADTALDASLPDSVQAVIAARLDTLPAQQKALLSDAAVVGSVFWDGALAAMGRHDPQELESVLSGLLERQMIRRIRESSMGGEREYAFVHALAREVAYGQLPRAVRARQHKVVAEWLEDRTGERARDMADVLAYHLTTAYDLAGAVQDEDLTAAVIEPAVKWLETAADRAQPVDVGAAERNYKRALEIAGAEHGARPALLLGLGETMLLKGEDGAAVEVLQDSVQLSTQRNDKSTLVRALRVLNFALRVTGRARPELIEQALSLARSEGSASDLITALESWGASQWVWNGDAHLAVEAVDEALAICKEQRLEPKASLMATRGAARCALGDPAGLDDYHHALEMARDPSAQGFGMDLSGVMSDYGVVLSWVKGPKASLEVVNDSIDFCERRGMFAAVRFIRGLALEDRLFAGDWRTLLEDSREFERELQQRESPEELASLRAVQVILSCWLGPTEDLAEALGVLETLRPSFSMQSMDAYDAVASSVALLALGQAEEAERRLRDWAETPQPESTVEYAWMVPEAVRVALRSSGVELANQLRHRGDGDLPIQHMVAASVDGLLGETRGEHEAAMTRFADAARRWHDFGVPYEEAHALLGQGRCLVALGRAPEAAAPLAAAREILARLGARPALAETDELMQQVASA